MHTEMEATMRMVLLLETSQPDGTVYRVGLGCDVPLQLLSIISILSRLF